MPDISMCANKTCLRRIRCYRFMAVPEPKWQLYTTFCTDNSKGKNCEYFSAIQPNDVVRKPGRENGRAKSRSNTTTKRARRRTSKAK